MDAEGLYERHLFGFYESKELIKMNMSPTSYVLATFGALKMSDNISAERKEQLEGLNAYTLAFQKKGYDLAAVQASKGASVGSGEAIYLHLVQPQHSDYFVEHYGDDFQQARQVRGQNKLSEWWNHLLDNPVMNKPPNVFLMGVPLNPNTSLVSTQVKQTLFKAVLFLYNFDLVKWLNDQLNAFK